MQLVQLIPNRLQDKQYKGILIKWCWKHLKLPEESPCKSFAFVAIAHILQGNEMANKIWLQVSMNASPVLWTNLCSLDNICSIWGRIHP